jgi:hypothetical protein
MSRHAFSTVRFPELIHLLQDKVPDSISVEDEEKILFFHELRNLLCHETDVLAVRKEDVRNYITARQLPQKIPDSASPDFQRRLGDSIYDFSKNPPQQRKSVHKEGNLRTDLSGQYALLSDHFYYFGNKPIPLPIDLRPIVKQSQGHRSQSNDPYFAKFVQWIENLGTSENLPLGEPQIDVFPSYDLIEKCANICRHDAEEDENSNSGC